MDHRRSAHALYHPSCRWLIQLINECHACLLATTYQVQASDRRFAEDYAEIVQDGQAQILRAQQISQSIEQDCHKEWVRTEKDCKKMREETENAKQLASELLVQAKKELDDAQEDAERLRDEAWEEAWDDAEEEIEREKQLLFEERRGLAKLKRKFEKEKEEWEQRRNEDVERSPRKRRMLDHEDKMCDA